MRFILIVLALFGSLYAYLAWGLFSVFPAPTKYIADFILLLFFICIVWVPLVTWRKESNELNRVEQVLHWIAYCCLGFINFAFLLLIVRDVASLFITSSLHHPEISELIILASIVLFLGGMIHARFGVKLKTVHVKFPGLAQELNGLKIVQITDLHVGPTIRHGFVKKVMETANSAQPDVVVLTGDLADGSVDQLANEIAPLAQIKAKSGKFFVTGNHEYYWEPKLWIEKISALGFQPLLNSHAVLTQSGKSIAIAGVADPAAPSVKMEGPDFAKASQGIPNHAFPKIILCHQPKFAATAEKHGFDLQLSGHTHGGQFFPWTLVTALVHRFNAGLGRLDKMQIYVSRGTGYWGPPVRLGAPPEVALLILES